MGAESLYPRYYRNMDLRWPDIQNIPWPGSTNYVGDDVDSSGWSVISIGQTYESPPLLTCETGFPIHMIHHLDGTGKVLHNLREWRRYISRDISLLQVNLLSKIPPRVIGRCCLDTPRLMSRKFCTNHHESSKRRLFITKTLSRRYQ